MNKQLTQELKDHYLKLAEEKVKSDHKKIQDFIRENELTSTSKQYHRNSEDYSYRVYDVAKTFWEADGYYDPPAKYIKNSEREKTFCQNVFEVINDNFIKESQEEINKQFFELVDKIIL